MPVSESDLVRAIRGFGLAGQPVCLHASMRSFGFVTGGAPTVVRAFLAAGCTLLVPTFTSCYAVEPRPEEQLPRNAWSAGRAPSTATHTYTPDTAAVDPDMGAVAAVLVRWPDRVRGEHPLNSFCAVGPLAHALLAEQTPENVYAPLRVLAERGGSVVLAGVGLERLTLLHLAEAEAGQELFRRWAAGAGNRVVRAAVGGCSEGFPRLEPVLAPLMQRGQVGASAWIVLPAAAALARATAAIAADAELTRCADPACERCRDAIAGGPLLDLPAAQPSDAGDEGPGMVAPQE
jgi:aminoglycoside N3'-acetyltransferase